MSAGAEISAGGSVDAVMAEPLSPQARVLLEQFAPEPSQRTIYLSTPITTGPRLLRWLADNRGAISASKASDSVDLVRHEVVNDNIGRLGPLREKLLADHPNGHLIDPTSLDVPGWEQWEYHRFWSEVLIAFADEIVFADGWELSTGCTVEYIVGLNHEIPMFDSAMAPLNPEVTAPLLLSAADELEQAGRSPSIARKAAAMARDHLIAGTLKDTALARLATEFNVASFISFTPQNPRIRHQVVPGVTLRRDTDARKAVELLLESSSSKSLNVRTFKPSISKGNPFYYGLTTVDQVVQQVISSAKDGYYTVVNETLDIHDGGVSGVSLGGVLEFSPDSTPRAVENEGSARLPVDLGNRLLKTIYGESVSIPHREGRRIEFSVHPHRVGYRNEHVIVWESEDVESVALDAPVSWPNAFSALIGDKTFGLLVADLCGARVPRTTVVARRVAPFHFGESTRTGDWWLRTSPRTQHPGRFTTVKGWTDPFALLADEDPDGELASVLAQEGIAAKYSGATMPAPGGFSDVIEGVAGYGDNFMLGAAEVAAIPEGVRARVQKVIESLAARLGPVRIEWVADEDDVWVVQLHALHGSLGLDEISPGEASEWLRFDPSGGLENLHGVVEQALDVGAGVEITKRIGVTSHVGDILRKAGVPARFSDHLAM